MTSMYCNHHPGLCWSPVWMDGLCKAHWRARSGVRANTAAIHDAQHRAGHRPPVRTKPPWAGHCLCDEPRTLLASGECVTCHKVGGPEWADLRVLARRERRMNPALD